MEASFNQSPDGNASVSGAGLLSGAVLAPTITEPVATANPAQAPSLAPAPVIGEDGKFSPQWYKGNADLEPFAKQLDKFSDPAGLAKSYAHLEKVRSVPAEGAEAGVIEAFRKANNIPSAPQEYDLNFPETLPDGIQIDEAAAGKYKELFHSLNLTPYQAQKLAEGHLQLTDEMFKTISSQSNEATLEAVGELRKEWGVKFDAQLATAQKTFDSLCARSGVNPEEVPFTNDPKFAKLMATVSGMLGESPVAGIAGVGEYLKSGKSEANDIMTNANHPDYKAFWNANDPRHGEVQDRVSRLSR